MFRSFLLFGLGVLYELQGWLSVKNENKKQKRENLERIVEINIRQEINNRNHIIVCLCHNIISRLLKRENARVSDISYNVIMFCCCCCFFAIIKTRVERVPCKKITKQKEEEERLIWWENLHTRQLEK